MVPSRGERMSETVRNMVCHVSTDCGQKKMSLGKRESEKEFSSFTRKTLGRALFAVAEHIPDVGYCQGLNFVAGVILLVVNDETRAIDLLVHLVSQRREYYGQNMIGLRRDMHVLHALLRENCPRVAVTLEKLDVGLDMIVGKWFVCWFVESLPMETVLRLWDCLIYEGDEWLFKVAVSLFRSNMMAIASCESVDQLLIEVQNIGTSKAALYCHQLILKSAALPITAQKIYTLRGEAEKAIAE
uniref:Rab-GAP TBC domain-containing protein n=1 Tax=Caenorhabditis japonica TaxID=281687 RepID=A0A8R1DYB5_CAEJA